MMPVFTVSFFLSYTILNTYTNELILASTLGHPLSLRLLKGVWHMFIYPTEILDVQTMSSHAHQNYDIIKKKPLSFTQ